MEEKLRCDIKDNYKWDLEKIYKNEEEIEKDIAYVKEECNNLLKYKGILCNMSDEAGNPVRCFAGVGSNNETLWGVMYL